MNAEQGFVPSQPEQEKQLEALGIRPIRYFDGARASSFPQTRLDEVRKAALKLREEMLSGPMAKFYQTVSLIRV
ncbi:MAG: hypothetical protein MI867_17245, partial [Pseudomonadales bacterium]|nr:hypothetical protein [Pseudomonadales bacterium]